MSKAKTAPVKFDDSYLWECIGNLEETITEMKDNLDVFMEDTASDLDGFRTELAALGDRIRKMERNTVPVYHRHTTMGVASSAPLDY